MSNNPTGTDASPILEDLEAMLNKIRACLIFADSTIDVMREHGVEMFSEKEAIKEARENFDELVDEAISLRRRWPFLN